VRQNWTRYWLVDPLDGTKEFLNRNGEFTVNIALIEDGRAGAGRGVRPGDRRDVSGASAAKPGKKIKASAVRLTSVNAHPPLVVVSRSHYATIRAERLSETARRTSDRFRRFFVEILPGGRKVLHSFTRALGPPIFGIPVPVMRWRLLRGKMNDWQGRPLLYTPRESFLNPGFRVSLF
jgi:3'(2'), 5'-bisphosphate nucleotidase